MPWKDPRDHEWSSPEPHDDDTCIRCDISWLRSSEWTCGGTDDRSPVPSLMARAAVPSDSYFSREAAVTGSQPVHVDEAVTEVRMSDVIDLTATNERWTTIEKRIREMFEEDLAILKNRAFEYGSDLDIQGRSMETLLPGRSHMSREQARVAGIEMAIASYLMGKSARLFGSWEHGMFPRPDNYRDLSNFGYMARAVREFGGWL